MKIGIDVDDVLADFVAEHRRIAREKFGRPHDPLTRPTDWEFSNYGLSEGELNEIWKDIGATENFWMTLERVPNVGCLPAMAATEELYFISSRRAGAGLPLAVQTAMWLEEAFPAIKRPVVLITKNKYEKADLAHALKLDAFIDDNVDNCVEVARARSDCRVFLKDTSHNQNFVGGHGIVRVKSLNEMYQILGGKEACGEIAA